MRAGYRFWPVIHEAQGGTSKSAGAAIRAIVTALVDRERRDPSSVRGELASRAAVVVARACARAIAKRASPHHVGAPVWFGIVAQTLREQVVDDHDD